MDFFELILRIAFELALDISYNGPKVTKVHPQKRFKLVQKYRNLYIFFKYVTIVILSSINVDIFMGKKVLNTMQLVSIIHTVPK